MTEEEFIGSASDAWRAYEKFLDGRTVRSDYTSTNDRGEVDYSQSDWVSFLDGESLVRTVFSDGSSQIDAINGRYGFGLSRIDSDSAWRIRDVGKIGDGSRMQPIERAVDGGVRYVSPHYVWREPLYQLVAEPYFKVLSIEECPQPGFPQAVKVVFDAKHDGRNAMGIWNWVQGGALWLDPSNAWLIIRALCELDDQSNPASFSDVVFEYETQADLRWSLPSKRIETDFDARLQPIPHSAVISHYAWSDVPPDPAAWRLTHYGLAEPAEETADGVSSLAEVRTLGDPEELESREARRYPLEIANLMSEALQWAGARFC